MDDYYDELRRKELEKLDRQREQLNERLDRQREHLNDRLERQRETLNARLERKMEVFGRLNERQQRIVDAALELLHEQGLNNLSLRDIAKRLHTHAPGIYWHFKNKEVLIDYLADEILLKEFKDAAPRAADQPWQEWLSQHLHRLRRAMLAYPDGARIVAGAHLYPATTLARVIELSLESLETAGFSPETAGTVTITAINFTFGHIIEEQAAPTAEEFDRHAEHVIELFKAFPRISRGINQHRAQLDETAAAYKLFDQSLQLIIRGATQ